MAHYIQSHNIWKTSDAKQNLSLEITLITRTLDREPISVVSTHHWYYMNNYIDLTDCPNSSMTLNALVLIVLVTDFDIYHV